MAINKTAFELVGVSYQNYVDWCKKTNRRISSTESKREFFARIKDGKLAKNPYTGELVVKKPRKKK